MQARDSGKFMLTLTLAEPGEEWELLMMSAKRWLDGCCMSKHHEHYLFGCLRAAQAQADAMSYMYAFRTGDAPDPHHVRYVQELEKQQILSGLTPRPAPGKGPARGSQDNESEEEDSESAAANLAGSAARRAQNRKARRAKAKKMTNYKKVLVQDKVEKREEYIAHYKRMFPDEIWTFPPKQGASEAAEEGGQGRYFLTNFVVSPD